MFVLKIVQMVMLKVGGHDIYSQVPASKRRANKTPRLTDTMFVAGKLHAESMRTHDIDGGRGLAELTSAWGCAAYSSGYLPCMWVPDPILCSIKFQSWRQLIVMDHWLWGLAFEKLPTFPRADVELRSCPDDPYGGEVVEASESMTPKLAGFCCRLFAGTCNEFRRITEHVPSYHNEVGACC